MRGVAKNGSETCGGEATRAAWDYDLRSGADPPLQFKLSPARAAERARIGTGIVDGHHRWALNRRKHGGDDHDPALKSSWPNLPRPSPKRRQAGGVTLGLVRRRATRETLIRLRLLLWLASGGGVQNPGKRLLSLVVFLLLAKGNSVHVALLSSGYEKECLVGHV